MDKVYDHTLDCEIECICWEGSVKGEEREIQAIMAEWADGGYIVVVRDGSALGDGDIKLNRLSREKQVKIVEEIEYRRKELNLNSVWQPKDDMKRLGVYQIHNTLTVSEASKEYGVDRSNLTKAFRNGWKRFREGIDCRKSGDNWIVTREAMEKAYGDNKGE